MGSNWVGGYVPTSSDDAVIDLTSAGTVSLSSNLSDSANSLTTNSKTTLTVENGSLAIVSGNSSFGGPVTVDSAASLSFGSNATLQIAAGQTLTDDGTLTFGAGATVELLEVNHSTTTLVVNGVLTTSGTTFSEGTSVNGIASIQVNSGGTISVSASTDANPQLSRNSGSTDTLHFVTLGSAAKLTINSGANVDISGNNFNSVGDKAIIAVGTATVTIPLENNYWGTTDSTAIENLILDQHDDSTRPTINFQPVWPNASGTVALPATAIFSASNQTVTLSAFVGTTGGIAISGGTETFTVMNGSTDIGQPTAATAVSNGSVTASYTLPGGTAVGQYTIDASYSGDTTYPTSTDTSQILTVSPAATQVAIASTALSLIAGNEGQVMVQIEDADGDPAASATDQTINLTTTSSVGAFYATQTSNAPITSVFIPAGQSSANVYYSDTQAGTPTLNVLDTALSATASTQQETVNPASAASFTVSTSFPNPDVAGTSATVIVAAYDTYGNLAASGPDQYKGTVDLRSTDTKLAGLPSTYTFTAADAGSHTFTNVILKTVGSQTFTATDSKTNTVTATSPAITVDSAAASQLVITQQPSSSATTGVAFATQPVVAEEDKYGNVLSSDNTSTVTAARGNVGTSTLEGTNLTVTLVNGVATFSGLSYGKAETMDISFSSDASGVTSTTSQDIVVSVSGASQLVVTKQPSSTVTAGNTFAAQPVITEEDAFGNVITTDSTSTVTAATGDLGTASLQGATLTVTLVDGVATFSGLSYDKSETMDISFTTKASGVSSTTSSNVAVSPAAASQLIIAQQPSATATASQTFTTQPVVYEEDRYNNDETGDNSTAIMATLSSGAGPLLGTTKVTVSGGVATFTNLADQTAETASLEFTGNGLTSLPSSSIVVKPATAEQLLIATQPSPIAMAGQVFSVQPVIYVEDQNGNIETNDNSTMVSVSLAGGLGLPDGTTSVTVTNGVATFTNLSVTQAGTIALKFTASTLSLTTPSTTTVSPAAATQLVVTTPPPASLTAGQTFTMGVSAEDPYGNVVPSFNDDVTISVPNDPGMSATVQAQNGLATFTGLTANTAAQGQSIQATSGNLKGGTSSPLTVTPLPTPTIIGEQIELIYLKHNKKGKPTGKPVVSIVFDFSIPMNPGTADYPNNYQVAWISTKKGKKTLHPIGVLSATPNASNTIVTLATSATQKMFAKGGQITVIYTPPSGVSSEADVPLTAGDSTFTIAPKATSIAPD